MTSEEMLGVIQKENKEIMDRITQSEKNITRENRVLLESFQKEVKTVGEGHEIIRQEMKQGFSELKTEIRNVALRVDQHDKKLANL